MYKLPLVAYIHKESYPLVLRKASGECFSFHDQKLKLCMSWNAFIMKHKHPFVRKTVFLCVDPVVGIYRRYKLHHEIVV